MDFKRTWKDNKKVVVMVGLGVGLLHVLQFLPETLDFFGDYTTMVYGGVIVFSAYTFYNFYWVAQGQRSMKGYDKFVPARNLKNPSYERDVRSGSVGGERRVNSDRGVGSSASFEGEKMSKDVSDKNASRFRSKESEIFNKFKNTD